MHRTIPTHAFATSERAHGTTSNILGLLAVIFLFIGSTPAHALFKGFDPQEGRAPSIH